MKAKKNLALATLVLCISFISAQPGTLDGTYGSAGVTITNIDSLSITDVTGLLQPDGRFIAGSFANLISVSECFVVSRYATNGLADTSFGHTGNVHFSFRSVNDISELTSVLLLPDGRILTGGYWSNTSGSSATFALAMLNSNGSFDSTFGTNGKVQTSGFKLALSSVVNLQLQQDGKIVALGYSTDLSNVIYPAMARYNPDGSLDVSFGVSGKMNGTYPISSSPSFLEIQSDGKILTADNDTNGTILHVVRLDTLGRPDSTFGMNGILQLANGTVGGGILPSNRTDGFTGLQYNADTSFTITYYTAQGLIDSSCGLDGITAGAFGNTTTLAPFLEPDGHWIFSSASIHPDGDFSMERFDSLGQLDNSFGTLGKEITDFGSTSDQGKVVAVQPDGKLMVVGTTFDLLNQNRELVVARYLNALNTGVINFAADNNTMLIYPNPIQQHEVLTYALQNQEQITIRLINAEGQLIKTIVENQSQTPGQHTQNIEMPAGMAAGAYFISISSAKGTVSVKLINK